MPAVAREIALVSAEYCNGDLGRPLIAELRVDRRQQIALVAGARGFAGQRDLLVGEVVALPDGGAQALGAGLLVEDAGRERERQLVRIDDPVVARVDVLREELRIVEVGQRTVEVGQLVLRAERYVGVIQPRLERLL